MKEISKIMRCVFSAVLIWFGTSLTASAHDDPPANESRKAAEEVSDFLVEALERLEKHYIIYQGGFRFLRVGQSRTEVEFSLIKMDIKAVLANERSLVLGSPEEPFEAREKLELRIEPSQGVLTITEGTITGRAILKLDSDWRDRFRRLKNREDADRFTAEYLLARPETNITWSDITDRSVEAPLREAEMWWTNYVDEEGQWYLRLHFAEDELAKIEIRYIPFELP